MEDNKVVYEIADDEQQVMPLEMKINEIEKQIKGLHEGFFVLHKRIDLLESVFKKLAEFDMRLDTLEFNSNVPVKPGISEKLLTLELKLDDLLNQGATTDER